jgi:hypothetical protein
MTFTSSSRAIHPSEPVLRWVFQRQAKAVTCEVDVLGNGSYDVYVVPHWDVSSSLVQHFTAPAGALLRHAQIARELRDRGWALVDRVASDRRAAA